MMATRTITFCYRKIIDANSIKPWEKLVFADTYAELTMQAQYFNQEKKYLTFAELLQHAPGAQQLHFLVSAAAMGYLRQLNEVIPDIVNNLGKYFLFFTKFQFEIINSDLRDPATHQVAINFYSAPVHWHDTIGNYLLVSDQPGPEGELLTHLVQIQPYLTIYSISPQA